MTESERNHIKKYVKKLEDAVDIYSSTNPFFNGIQESCVFDVISEIINVFSNDISSLKDAVILRSGTAIRDANSVIGILNYHLAKHDEEHVVESTESTKNDKIFISHRSTDKDIAGLIENFLSLCGVDSAKIFCSSLPGNDIKEKISEEVKENLQRSALNIVLLSKDYYNSSYCQNESGIIWYADVPKIIIALPEINENNMLGFLNNDHKIRRLDIRNDVLSICDIVKEHYNGKFIESNAKLDVYVSELNERYANLIKCRKNILYPDAKGYYSTTIVEDRKLHNGYRCYRINGLLPTGEPFADDETHWIFYKASTYPELSEGSHIRFKPKDKPQSLRDFDDISNTRNIYLSSLEIL